MHDEDLLSLEAERVRQLSQEGQVRLAERVDPSVLELAVLRVAASSAGLAPRLVGKEGRIVVVAADAGEAALARIGDSLG